MHKPKIEYPCWWPYTIIGLDEEQLRLVVAEVANGLQHKTEFSKLSAQKKYVSLHVEIHVSSQKERDRLFEAFKSNPHVRHVL